MSDSWNGLTGGVEDIIGGAIDTVGDVIDTAVNIIGDVGNSIDSFVNDNIPGGPVEVWEITGDA